MRPAARVQAVIDLLGEVGEQPADRILSKYFRSRRYIGAKDRRAVTDLFYRIIRNQSKLSWRLEQADLEVTPRRLALAALALVEQCPVTEIAALFDGSLYGPEALAPDEQDLTARLASTALSHGDEPPWVRAELPRWLYERLAISLGEGLEAELAALAGEAPVDLRVNLLKTDRDGALRQLAGEGVEAEPTAWSPLGLRLRGRRTLPALETFRAGLVEVQDEGSQLVAFLTDARPGMTIADFCAGGGGKTLALAAAMQGEGRLVALDRSSHRLGRARPRLKRAGAEWAELQVISGLVDPLGDPWIEQNQGAFDRVLVDAPCSGSGAWRRNPDAPWRLMPEVLESHLGEQRKILAAAAGLVAPGGRLIYATCSLLAEENGAQAQWLLSARSDYTPSPVAEVWEQVLPGACPSDAVTLQLTPGRHGTDGFFVAIFRRDG